VTFLVDNQLPPALARFLTSKGHTARHVIDIGLDEDTDKAVWDYAVRHRMALVSKDEDFLALANRVGKTTPWIWVRLGNCRKQRLLAAFATAWPQLQAALQRGDRIIELR
jgi:predicted nuclease of predicted toxin-antitoxin system